MIYSSVIDSLSRQGQDPLLMAKNMRGTALAAIIAVSAVALGKFFKYLNGEPTQNTDEAKKIHNDTFNGKMSRRCYAVANLTGLIVVIGAISLVHGIMQNYSA